VTEGAAAGVQYVPDSYYLSFGHEEFHMPAHLGDRPPYGSRRRVTVGGASACHAAGIPSRS